jgi:hypothetical protein
LHHEILRTTVSQQNVKIVTNLSLFITKISHKIYQNVSEQNTSSFYSNTTTENKFLKWFSVNFISWSYGFRVVGLNGIIDSHLYWDKFNLILKRKNINKVMICFLLWIWYWTKLCLYFTQKKSVNDAWKNASILTIQTNTCLVYFIYIRNNNPFCIN